MVGRSFLYLNVEELVDVRERRRRPQGRRVGTTRRASSAHALTLPSCTPGPPAAAPLPVCCPLPPCPAHARTLLSSWAHPWHLPRLLGPGWIRDAVDVLACATVVLDGAGRPTATHPLRLFACGLAGENPLSGWIENGASCLLFFFEVGFVKLMWVIDFNSA